MTDSQLEELGPIDYMVIEWPGRQPTGEAAPLILDLHDRGIIRIMDVAFMVKDEDGNAAGVSLDEFGVEEFSDFEGASSGLLGDGKWVPLPQPTPQEGYGDDEPL